MRINITARKFTLKDYFRELVERKISKFERIFGDDAEVYVTVTVAKNRETVEITVKQGGIVFRAEKTAEDKNEALDEAINALGRQIRKNKVKLDKRIHSAALADIFTKSDVPADEIEYKVVKNKSFPVKPMDVDEAILQMNMVGHQFYMFRNSKTDEINVLYRRKDNNYGVLEPEK